MKTTILLATLIGIAAFATRASRADVIYNSYDSSAGVSTAVSTGPVGDQFESGSTASTITDLQIYLTNPTPTDGGSITISLATDDSDAPSLSGMTTLATLNDETTGPNVYDFNSLDANTLAANTQYWIVLTTTNSSGFDWLFTSSSSGTGVAGEYYYYGNPGSSISTTDANYHGAFEMQVSVTPAISVPEPSSLALCGLGALGGLALRTYRRRRASSAV